MSSTQESPKGSPTSLKLGGRSRKSKKAVAVKKLPKHKTDFQIMPRQGYRRIAKMGSVKRMGKVALDYADKVFVTFVEDLANKAGSMAEHSRRRTVMESDIIESAMMIGGRKLVL
jgi:histone H3/H4